VAGFLAQTAPLAEWLEQHIVKPAEPAAGRRRR